MLNIKTLRKTTDIEQIFKVRVLHMSAIITVFVLLVEIIAYHFILTNKFSYDFCLNIFPQDSPVKAMTVMPEEHAQMCGVSMRIEDASIKNNVVIIRMSGENMTQNYIDVAFGGEYLLTVINPESVPVRKYYYRITKASCIAKANSDYSFTLYYNLADLNTKNNIYTLSVYRENCGTAEFILPDEDKILK